MKNLHNVRSGHRLDEIVFQDRNKSYGAYALRREEGTVLGKAMFFGISIFVFLGITPLVISGVSSGKTLEPEIINPPQWVPVPEIDRPDRVIDPPAAAPIQLATQSYNSAVPVPKQNAEEPSASVINRNEAVPGLQDTPGEAPVNTYTPPSINSGTNVLPTEVVPPVADPNAIPVKVDVMADFQGGIQAFRKKVIQKFDGAAYEGSGEKISSVVTFVVEKDGSISAVKASGKDAEFNREAEKAVTAAKGKWNPAVLDGQKVRSYFRIPVTMQFD